MAEAQQEHRLANYRSAYTTLDRLWELAPPEREPAIEETMGELQRQIQELEQEVEAE